MASYTDRIRERDAACADLEHTRRSEELQRACTVAALELAAARNTPDEALAYMKCLAAVEAHDEHENTVSGAIFKTLAHLTSERTQAQALVAEAMDTVKEEREAAKKSRAKKGKSNVQDAITDTLRRGGHTI